MKCHICGEEITGSYLEHMKKHIEPLWKEEKVQSLEEMAENLKKFTKEVGGEITETKTRLICEPAEEVRIVLHKTQGWIKFYDPKLRIWGVPESIRIVRFKALVFGKTTDVTRLTIDFKEPDISVNISSTPTVMFMSPLYDVYIAPKFRQKYEEALRRIRRARLAKIGRY